MGSLFNVSLTVRDKVTRQCPQTTISEERAKVDFNRGPSAYQPNALPLGQTGSKQVRDVFFLLVALTVIL